MKVNIVYLNNKLSLLAEIEEDDKLNHINKSCSHKKQKY